jgi:hypothetical protein
VNGTPPADDALCRTFNTGNAFRAGHSSYTRSPPSLVFPGLSRLLELSNLALGNGDMFVQRARYAWH